MQTVLEPDPEKNNVKQVTLAEKKAEIAYNVSVCANFKVFKLLKEYLCVFPNFLSLSSPELTE